MADIKDGQSMAPPEIDYKPKIYVSGTYDVLSLKPLTPPELGLNNTTECEIEIPSGVCNLNKNLLEFNGLLPAVAARYGFMFADRIQLQNVELYDINNTKIVDLRNVDVITKLMQGPQTEFSDYVSNPRFDVAHPQTVATVRESGAYLGPALVKNEENYVQVEGTALPADLILSAATAYPKESNNGTAYVSTLNGQAIELAKAPIPVQRFIRTDTVNQALAFKVSFPLSAIPFSMFQNKQDIFFPTKMTLKLVFTPGINWGFQTTGVAAVGQYVVAVGTGGPPLVLASLAAATAAINLSVNNLRAKAPAFPDYTGQAALTVTPAISNVILKHYRQSDATIAGVIRDKVMAEGLMLTIPYAYTYEQAVGADEISHNMYKTMNIGNGQRLRAVVTGIFNGTSTGSTRLQNYNEGGLLWTSMRSSINSQPLQNSKLEVLDNGVYNHLKEYFNGSCITSAADWAQNAVFIDDFSGMHSSVETKNKSDVHTGLPLADMPIQYTTEIEKPAATALRMYQIYVTDRQMMVNALGIRLM